MEMPFALQLGQAHEDVFQMLLDRGAPTTQAALTQACAASLEGSVLGLLNSGLELDGDNEEGGRVLHAAAFNSRHSMVELLAARGADLNYVTDRYGSPLQATLEGRASIELQSSLGLIPMARSMREPMLLSRTTGFAKENVTPKTSRLGRLQPWEQIACFLLNRGVDILTKQRTHGTPLHLAAYDGSVDVVQKLLDKGADPNSDCPFFGTPLLAAVLGARKDIVDILLQRGSDVSHICATRGSALHCACQNADEAVIEILLQNGADVKARGGLHDTVLSAALSGKRRLWESIVKRIMQHEEYKLTEIDLITAASYERFQSDDFVNLLLDHISEVIVIPEPVVIAAIRAFSSTRKEMLQLMLR